MRVVTLLMMVAPLAVAAPAQAETAKVTLDEAGRGDKVKLRYAFKPKSVSKMTVHTDLDMQLGMGMGGAPKMKILGQVFDVTIKVNKIDRAGSAQCAFEFSQIRVAPSGKIPKATRTKINAQLAKLGKVTGSALVTERGLVSKVKLKASKPDPGLAQLMQAFEQLLHRAAIPLPAEPIGRQAEWTARSTAKVGGIEFSETTRYTLVSRDAKSFRVRAKIERSAGKQKVKLPNMPPSIKATLVSADVDGKLTATVYAGGLTSDAKSSSTSKLILSISAGAGNSQKMGLSMDRRVKMSRKN